MARAAQTDAAEVVRFPEYHTVDRTILERHDHLVAHYGAHHVGASKKYTAGRKLPETCITFYVLRKGAAHARNLIPPFLDLVYEPGSRPRQIATDVCEILEQPVGLGIRGGNAVLSADNEQGTVGLVLNLGDRDFLVTNAHVVTDAGQPPGLVTIGVQGGAVQGIVRQLDNLNAPRIESDAALVEVPPGSIESGKFRGTELVLAGYDEIANNDPRKFFFVSHEFVHQAAWTGWVAATAPIVIDGQVKNYAGFHKLKVVVGQARPGNSGAVVFCQSAAGLVAVGLLFGGTLAINEIWVFPVRRCLQRMGVLA